MNRQPRKPGDLYERISAAHPRYRPWETGPPPPPRYAVPALGHCAIPTGARSPVRQCASPRGPLDRNQWHTYRLAPAIGPRRAGGPGETRLLVLTYGTGREFNSATALIGGHCPFSAPRLQSIAEPPWPW